MKSRDTTTLVDQLTAHRLPRYQDLPAFGLYVDQLISYVNEQVGMYATSDEKLLTASMVNNYVKHEVLPKPEKKKYSRNHLAYLIVVCILKKVFSITEISRLIALQIETASIEDAYNSFADSLHQSIRSVVGGGKQIPQADVTQTRTDNALLLDRAVLTFSNKLFVQRTLALEATPQEKPVKQDKRKQS